MLGQVFQQAASVILGKPALKILLTGEESIDRTLEQLSVDDIQVETENTDPKGKFHLKVWVSWFDTLLNIDQTALPLFLFKKSFKFQFTR